MAEQEQNLEQRVEGYIAKRERVRVAYAGRLAIHMGDPKTLYELEEELNVLRAFHRGLLVGRGQAEPIIELRHSSEIIDGERIEKIKFDDGIIIRTSKTEG